MIITKSFRTLSRALGFLLTLTLVTIFSEPAFAADYHVDASGGDDVSGDGSLAAPWQTLGRLSTVALAPGDQVLLRRGSVFRERLDVSASGTADDPIVIDAYGAGAAPVVSAGHLIAQGAAWTGPDADGEFQVVAGPTSDFYTSVAALVRANPVGTETYRLLARGTAGSLAEDTYALLNVNGERTIVYRPPAGANPADFDFELSRRNHAVSITGDWVIVRNVDAILGNVGHPTVDAPLADATFISTGAHTVIENARAAFGRANGIAVAGPHTTIDGSVGEHNHSTGLYILGSAAVGCTIRNSVSRFNGNLEFQDLDRGGIGVQGDDAVIVGNVVHDNGNVADTVGPRIAGDDAISLFDASNALVAQNFVYNSARGAIRMSWTPDSFGHRIEGNVIVNWNLVELTGTLGTQAIAMVGFGDTSSSGNHTIVNNTIYSDQVDARLIGIQLALPTNEDVMRDTVVLNNIVYFPVNTASDSSGIRLTREHLFDAVTIDHNAVWLPQTGNSYSSFAGVFTAAADLFAALGYEANGLNLDPLFTGDPAVISDPMSFDLADGSPMVDAGTPAGVTTDFIGRSVPAGAAPDIGAFEQPSGCPDSDGDGVCDADDLCPAGALQIDGLLAPLGALAPGDEPLVIPEKSFRVNRTLPLKLDMYCDGVLLTEEDVAPPAIASVRRVGDTEDLEESDLDSGASNDHGSLFRFGDPHWIYNLSTKAFEPGTHVITIVTPEGVPYRAGVVME